MQVNILDIMKYMDTTQQPYSVKYKHNVSFPMLKNNRRPSIKANTKGTTIRPHIKKIIVQLNRFSLLWFCTYANEVCWRNSSENHSKEICIQTRKSVRSPPFTPIHWIVRFWWLLCKSDLSGWENTALMEDFIKEWCIDRRYTLIQTNSFQW